MITIESTSKPTGRLALEALRDCFVDILEKGLFVHCIDVFKLGGSEYKYVIRIFTKAGECQHSKESECAAYLKKIDEKLWFAFPDSIKNQIEDAKEAEKLNLAKKMIMENHSVELEKIFSQGMSRIRSKMLDEYIKFTVQEYPWYYKVSKDATEENKT